MAGTYKPFDKLSLLKEVFMTTGFTAGLARSFERFALVLSRAMLKTRVPSERHSLTSPRQPGAFSLVLLSRPKLQHICQAS